MRLTSALPSPLHNPPASSLSCLYNIPVSSPSSTSDLLRVQILPQLQASLLITHPRVRALALARIHKALQDPRSDAMRTVKLFAALSAAPVLP